MFNQIEKNTKNEIILPVLFPPPIVNYLHFAHYLSILLSNDKHKNWFFGNFIHVLYNINANQQFNFYMQNQFDCISSFFVDTYKLHNGILNINKIDIINDIINWIDNEYYVKVNVGSTMIPNNYMYYEEDFLLPVFIYGYNKDKGIFYTHNFSLDRTYSVIEVSFSDLEKAFYSDNSKKIINTVPYVSKREQGEDYFINLYKINKQIHNYYNFSFYLEKMRNSILLYVDGDNVLSKNSEIIKVNDVMEYNENDYYWGLNVYDGIIQQMPLTYNIYHGLFEHKNIMNMRLEYLRSKEVLKTDELLLKYSEVVDAANKLRLLCIKANMKKEASQNADLTGLINKMIELLNKIKIKEKDVLLSVIESMIFIK